MRKKILIWMLMPVLILATAQAAKADILDEIINRQFDSKALGEAVLDSILNDKQKLSDDEALLPQNRYGIGCENKQKMFRNSFWANYYLIDHKKNERIPLCDTLVRDAAMSPNGQYIVYGKGQDLYIYKTLYKTEVAITQNGMNGNPVDVFNGVSDWLYEEEFGITRLFSFSPDSKLVAFVRLDEQNVPTFTWQVYRDKQYPEAQSLRYPKAGQPNAKASVCVYDISTKGIRTMKLPAMDEAYIPRLAWRQVGEEYELIIERINRDQNQMEVFVANPKSTVCTILYKEKSDRYYIDYAHFDQWQWLSDGRFIALSEKNGWRQLFLHSAQGAEQKKLTPAEMDVTRVYGMDEKSGVVYYEAAPKAAERQAYAVNIKTAKSTRLTSGDGMHSLTFAKNMKRAADFYQNIHQAGQYTLYDVLADRLKAVSTNAFDAINTLNKDRQTAWEATGLPNKQFIRIPTERGDSLDAWIILPKDYAGKKSPVVMMQYSGPASQRVLNQWRHRFGHYLATQGYIVVNADPRGTDCRGRQWRNETYMRLGQKEAEDQLSVAKYIQSQSYVDANRIAMIGWSYGGFQTIRTMMEQTEPIIGCGVAIAPVTDWGLYDTGYTERFMRRPQVNERGYEGANLTAMADRLQGRLLLVHATGDDNVHWHNTLLLSDALVRAGKQFDTQLYIDDNHSLLDKVNNRHLHEKILQFLKSNL
ncbi:MAG: S9 family peptidase [Paludibacteraceae bacterium]|nr:S9 family peptidase [Paludibacteraceae bacterium]